MQVIMSTDAAYPLIIHMVMDFWEVPITFTFLIITNEMPVYSSILAYQAYRWSSPLSYFIKFM